MAELTPKDRVALYNQMDTLFHELDASSHALWRCTRELRAMDGDAAAVPPRGAVPYEQVPIAPAVMAKTAAEVICNPPTMPDFRVPDSRPEFRATPAAALEPLIGVLELGGDAVEDGEAIYEDDTGPTPEQQAAWREWEERGPQGPIEDANDVSAALLLRLRTYFATIAGPTFSGAVAAVRGYAECAEALGDTGSTIEAYEALLARAREDDKPPPWVTDLRAKIAALRGSGDL